MFIVILLKILFHTTFNTWCPNCGFCLNCERISSLIFISSCLFLPNGCNITLFLKSKMAGKFSFGEITIPYYSWDNWNCPEWPGNPSSTLSALLGGYMSTQDTFLTFAFGKRGWLASHWMVSCLSGLFGWDLNHWGLCRQQGSTAALEIFLSNLKMTLILWKISPKTDIFN